MDHQAINEARNLAVRLADIARKTSLAHFRTSIGFEVKADKTPVTIADRAIEDEMRQMIGSVFPDHAVIGEEMGADEPGAMTWVIDPIDGTKCFVMGFPIYGSLICLMEGNCPIIGVIEIPATAERWVGGPSGTNRNDIPVQVSQCKTLAQTRIAATSPSDFDEAGYKLFRKLADQCAMERFGGGCYSTGLLASGFVDLVVEAGLEPWDFLALVPVVEGAGGVISDWNGHKLDYSSGGKVVAAASPELLAAACKILGRYDTP